MGWAYVWSMAGHRLEGVGDGLGSKLVDNTVHY